jgi:hypothetical protein
VSPGIPLRGNLGRDDFRNDLTTPLHSPGPQPTAHHLRTSLRRVLRSLGRHVREQVWHVPPGPQPAHRVKPCTNAGCGHEYFRPFSCKGFYLRPACSQKRTLLFTEHLTNDDWNYRGTSDLRRPVAPESSFPLPCPGLTTRSRLPMRGAGNALRSTSHGLRCRRGRSAVNSQGPGAVPHRVLGVLRITHHA